MGTRSVPSTKGFLISDMVRGVGKGERVDKEKGEGAGKGRGVHEGKRAKARGGARARVWLGIFFQRSLI